MPSTKQFEYMTLTIPFEINHMDMYEMAEHHANQIKQLFKTIEKEKKENYYATVEIPNDDDHWHIWKEEGRFIFKNARNDGSPGKNLSPIEFYNWCFEKAPFFGMVGIGSNG